MDKAFKTLAEFLTSKEITKEAFGELEPDKQVSLLKEHGESQDAYIKALEADVNNKISKEDIAKMKEEMKLTFDEENKAFKEAMSKQGVAITKLLKSFQGAPLSTTEKSQINKFIADNASEIQKIRDNKTGEISFTTKVVGDITTASASNPNGIPAIVGVQVAPPGNVNLRATISDRFTTRFTTSLSAFPYSDMEPKEGDFTWVAEGGTKPQIDFQIKTRYATPKKVAAHEILTDESLKDIPGLQSMATDYLRKKHDLKRQNGILFGTGIADDPIGATAYGRVFVAGAMALAVPLPNFMDAVNAAITDIFTTHNYADEEPYVANLVMVNPIDFYLQLVSAKDGDGKPLYPMASLFNQVQIGSATIVPFEDIPAGKLFVCDLSKYMVSNYEPYTVRIGYINDQLITNKITMVGESRLHAFVKFLDEQAFIYDDIATIKVAITAA